MLPTPLLRVHMTGMLQDYGVYGFIIHHYWSVHPSPVASMHYRGDCDGHICSAALFPMARA
jgi:hypothetical protein